MSRHVDPIETALRERGHGGGVIVPHRAILTLDLRAARIALSATLGVALAVAWFLAINQVSRLWMAILEFWRGALGLTASVQPVRYTVLHRFHLEFPMVAATAAPLSRTIWLTTIAVTAIAFLVSFLLPRRRALPLVYLLRLAALVQTSSLVFFWLFPGAFPYDIAGYTHVVLIAGMFLTGLVPVLLGATYFTLDFSRKKKLALVLLVMLHLTLFIPMQYLGHAILIHHGSLLVMPLLFWMFGLPLDVGLIVGLYAWAMSWRTLPYHQATWPRRPRTWANGTKAAGKAAKASKTRTARTPGTAGTAGTAGMAGVAATAGAAVLALIAGGASTARATDVAWTRLLELGASYGHYTAGLGTSDAEFASFTLARAFVDGWRVDVGRAARFGDEGVGAGLSYTRFLRRDTSASLGFSTGTGEVIFPDWRFDAGIMHGMLRADRLTLNAGYTHVQSKAENRSDGFGVGLRYGLGGPWSLAASGRIDLGYPGRTTSRSAGAGLLYNQHRKLVLGAGFETGTVAYMLVGPSTALVGYNSHSYNAAGTLYLRHDRGVSLRYDVSTTDFYDQWAITLKIFQEW
jgi:YaiO family outer membrane protein